MHIRQMNGGDVAPVAAIESSSFSPWSREQVAAELQRKTGLAFVAVAAAGELQGWCCGLRAGADAELLKITVNPAKRRQGIAEALLLELCFQFKLHETVQIFLEVRSQNLPALRLYAKLGFLETGRRRNYYKEPADDAVILVCRVSEKQSNINNNRKRLHECNS
jgi:ribosomal-protein-alanine N-acetyltransferase